MYYSKFAQSQKGGLLLQPFIETPTRREQSNAATPQRALQCQLQFDGKCRIQTGDPLHVIMCLECC